MATAMTIPRDETSLLAEAREGSDGAFREIVELFSDRLYAVVFKILGHRSDAEEVLQDTFLRAYKNLSGFQEGSSLFTWLYRIAVNAAVDLAKKRQRRRHLSLDDDELRLDGVLQDPGPEPAAPAEQAEMVDLVQEGIQALPERYRAILVLREFSEMSYEQLGEVLELPKGTVESRLFRARMKLKDWLLRRLQDSGLDAESMGWI